MLQLTLHIDALFEHFKQSTNKQSQICQSKSYIAPPRFNKKGDGWLVQIYWKSRLIRPWVKLVGSFRNCPFMSMCIRKQMARHAISQLLTLQIVMLIVDSEYARYILSLHTAGLCYKQPLDNCIYTACEYFFLKLPLSVTPIRIIPVNKRLRKLG